MNSSVVPSCKTSPLSVDWTKRTETVKTFTASPLQGLALGVPCLKFLQSSAMTMANSTSVPTTSGVDEGKKMGAEGFLVAVEGFKKTSGMVGWGQSSSAAWTLKSRPMQRTLPTSVGPIEDTVLFVWAIAVLTHFMLPDDLEHARFLNEVEKAMMHPDFDWAGVKRVVKDPKLYIFPWSQFMANICTFGLSSFLPLITHSFGYDVVTTQLLTIPVFFWASATYMVVSYMSDKWKQRAMFMVPACLVTTVGYAVNLGVGQIFRTKKNDKHAIGLSGSLAAAILAVLGHITLQTYLHREDNRRKTLTENKRKAEIAAGKEPDFHPDYRYAL
ncbi:uncharacterized protein J7T54_002554 [Emericellopsis cladophorae]|uniref:Uncharacterized protein n=1 Tax=Emericellopsis cladophorae TaxID=2686198 RepID=A0A9P9Y096_9HYPO|nr:uncharacterized protein J7T54_002554 [Emericellopsis cladophorae]KAI6781198.1 hypothetical protein J7T54_002554 [Emericellopsis cladophorae]